MSDAQKPDAPKSAQHQEAETPVADTPTPDQPEGEEGAAAADKAASTASDTDLAEPKDSAGSDRHSTNKLPLIAAIAALLAIAVLGYIGYTTSQQLSSRLNSSEQRLSDLLSSQQSAQRSQLSQLEGEILRLDEERETQNLLLERTQARLTEAIKQVEAGRNTSQTDWRLAEAEYLLRLANQRVLMEKRPEGALRLLQSTDKMLAELDDVTLYPLRQALARDIAALEAVPKLDIEGTYLRLAAQIDQVRELPTLSLEQQRQLPELLQEITPEGIDASIKQDIETVFGRALERLQSLVIIQRHDTAVEPLLSPEQGHYLRQNVQLLLEQAQLALLRQQQTIYDTSLTRAQDLLKRYFDINNSATQAISSALSELSGLKVAAEIPDISGSLTALKQHIEDMTRLGREAQR